VEVSTVRAAHTLYSVGVFVRSPIRIDASISPRRPVRGAPLEVKVDVWDGSRGVTDLTGTVCVTVPTSSPDRLVANFGRRLKSLSLLRTVRRDPVPEAFRDALTINASLVKEGRTAIAHETKCSPMKQPSASGGGGGIVVTPVGGGGGGVVVTPVGGGGGGVVVTPVGGGGGPVVTPGGTGGMVATTDAVGSIVVDRASLLASPSAALSALTALRLSIGPTTLVGAHPGSAHPGSVSAKVTVQGTSSGGNRFVRTTNRAARVS
jgi:hypothetical protein